MTYCVAMSLEAGLILAADSRTNAGVDQIAVFRKLWVREKPGEKVLIMTTAGNLAISQAVMERLDRGLGDREPKRLLDAKTMYDAARLVGAAVRDVYELDGEALARDGTNFSVSIGLGGQIAGGPPRLFQIYAAGNFIESSPSTPYFLMGEVKYGKPIIDRLVRYETSLADAIKCVMVSMDSTLRSNISVGLPIDIAVYRKDSLRLDVQRKVDGDDPYFNEIRRRWGDGLRAAHATLPEPDWL
jgi:putative proteasome-type protease